MGSKLPAGLACKTGILKDRILKEYFAGKTAVITGGSSGIGLAIARRLLALDANVVLIARNPTRLKRVARELEAEFAELTATSVARTPSSSRRVSYYSLSVDEYGHVKKAFALLRKDGRAPDILINSAGIGFPGYVDQIPLKKYRKLLNVNLMGTVYCVKAILPDLFKKGGGHIVNVSSAAGFVGIFGFTAYSAAKFGVQGFSESLRAEMKARGIRVSLLCPPDTDTPMMSDPKRPQLPEVEAISSQGGKLSADFVARKTLEAMVQDKFLILPGLRVRYVYFMTRYFPGLARFVMDRQVRKTKVRS